MKLFKKDSRKQYRTKDKDFSPLQFNLVLPGRELLPGAIFNTSMNGAAIAFEPQRLPNLALNERVKLQLTMTQSKKVIMVDATLKHLKNANNNVICRFQFADPSSLAKNLDISLMSYFNRREAYRVKPDINEPIEVDVEWNGGSTQGHVIDISLTGMGLGVKPDVTEIPGYPEPVTLSFRLPISEKTLMIVGTTVHPRSLGKIILYGIKYDWGQTENSYQQESVITSYVIYRQREIIGRIKED
ncbi:MAG: PilZ domain-containing protein [Desulfobacterales bacterium]|jgi:hypothetical protein